MKSLLYWKFILTGVCVCQETKSVNFVAVVSGVLWNAVVAVYRAADCRVLVFGHGHCLFSHVHCYVKASFRWCRLRHRVSTSLAVRVGLELRPFMIAHRLPGVLFLKQKKRAFIFPPSPVSFSCLLFVVWKIKDSLVHKFLGGSVTCHFKITLDVTVKCFRWAADVLLFYSVICTRS